MPSILSPWGGGGGGGLQHLSGVDKTAKDIKP